MIINEYQLNPCLLGFGVPQRTYSYLFGRPKWCVYTKSRISRPIWANYQKLLSFWKITNFACITFEAFYLNCIIKAYKCKFISMIWIKVCLWLLWRIVEVDLPTKLGLSVIVSRSDRVQYNGLIVAVLNVYHRYYALFHYFKWAIFYLLSWYAHALQQPRKRSFTHHYLHKFHLQQAQHHFQLYCAKK